MGWVIFFSSVRQGIRWFGQMPEGCSRNIDGGGGGVNKPFE